MATRRGHGEGSIYKRASDGRWVGTADLGWKDGRRERKVIYGRTRKEVADRLKALLPQADAGQVTGGRVPTVEAWMTTWLEAAQHRLAPKTWASYSWIAGKYIVPVLGKRRLDRLAAVEVEAMTTAMMDRGLSRRTAQYAHRVLSMALADAVKKRKAASNPAALVDAPRPRKAAQGALSAAEARKLLAAAQEARHGALWVLALTTGMRQAEILTLRWADVDLEARTVRIRDGKTAKSRRSVSLTDVAIRMLGEPGDPQALVFPSRAGTPIGARNLVRAWHAFTLEVLGRTVRFHDLRHTAATLMLEAGVPLKVISEILGHSSIQVTSDIYTEVVDALKADAAARMDGVFAA